MTETFEALKYALRQARDGLVVSFVIHPSDIPDALLLAPIGTRWVLAAVEIADDEQPKQPEIIHEPAPINRSDAARKAYDQADPMAQARTRSVLLAKDRQFQQWALNRGSDAMTEAAAAQFIRKSCCDGLSRAEIATDHVSYGAFLALEADFSERV